MNILKYHKNSILNLKKNQGCYLFLNNQITESLIFSVKSKCYLNLGFNNLIEYKVISIFKKITLVTIYSPNLLFEDLLINNFVNKNIFIFSYVWFFIKKCYKSCCYLRGIFLNDSENGFCIGICGTVGLLPQNNYSFVNLNKKTKSSLFFVTKLNFSNKTYIVSQENILKQSTRVFFKLTVGLNYTCKDKDVVLADMSKRL